MRDTAATALEESASACPHSRRGLTPLGRLQKYPKIHVSTGEESSGSGPNSSQGLRPRYRRERNPQRPPRNSHGDWPFLRPPERVPEVPVPKIDSHHVCKGDSPLGKPRGKDSRENHRYLDPRGGLRDTAATALEESASACPHSRRGLTPLGRLQEYPKIHVSTREESSGSGPDSTQGLRPRHRRERNTERPPRNSHGDWPFLRPPERVPEVPVKYTKIHVISGEESSGSGFDSTQGLRPRHRRERNPEWPPWNSHGDWPFLRPPERVHDVLVPRVDSHHVCTWDSPVESLVGKPHGKDSRENHRSFDPRCGMRDSAATALEESASAWPHSRRGLTPLGRLQKYPKIHVSTGEESSGSGPNTTQGLRPRNRRERNPQRPPRNSHGDWPFLRPPERVLRSPSNLFSLHCLDVQAEDRLPPRVHVGQPCGKASWESLVGKTRGKAIDPLILAANCVTLLLRLWRKAQVHARIREED
ncbi:hypothetical protein MJT46_014344 [Ovis ammon polii x Ovis aries]|nr:hypothetical protein MJT46_014344 [Ovis ammon polii x Ovis aries]